MRSVMIALVSALLLAGCAGGDADSSDSQGRRLTKAERDYLAYLRYDVDEAQLSDDQAITIGYEACRALTEEGKPGWESYRLQLREQGVPQGNYVPESGVRYLCPKMEWLTQVK